MRLGLHRLAVCAGLFARAPWPADCLAENRVPFEALYRQAYELRASQLGPAHPHTIRSLVSLGALLRAHSRPGDAEPLLRKALIASGQSGPADTGTLTELAETLAALGRNAEAEDIYRQAVEQSESMEGKARMLLRVAALRQRSGDAGGASEAFRRALENFAKAGPLATEALKARASALNDLGLLLEEQGAFEDALVLYRRADEAHADVFGKAHPATAAARANLAGALARSGEAAAAADLLERSVVVFQGAYGPRHDDTARLRNRLGELYEVLGRHERAEVEYRAALAAWEGPSSSRGMALADLGRLLGVRGDLEAAEAMLVEAVGVLKSAKPDLALELAEACDSYGSVLRAQGRLDEAEPQLREALAIRERELGASHSDVALTLVGLAGVLHLRGDLVLARPLYLRALEIQEAALGVTHPDVGETLFNLAHLWQALGDIAAARAGLERAAEILSEAYGPGDPFVREIRATLQALR